jgi:hypothetical protein
MSPLLLAGIFGGLSKIFYGYIFEGFILTLICMMSSLGIIGLWLVVIQSKYKSLINMMLIGCGTIVGLAFYIGGLFLSPDWYLPTSLAKDTFELVGATTVLAFGLFYSFNIGKSLVNKSINKDDA